ncbi:MAG TPA: cytochrome c biogenesis protein CcsA [Armatimonadota bacterium]|nr:cytochrome c biogenesis protein CcsA [Armatimonadota bacterium]
MIHQHFLILGWSAFALWCVALTGYLLGNIPAFQQRTRGLLATLPLIIGWVLLAVYLVDLWQHLGHPPMRSIPQTLLWAAFFLPPVTLGMEWTRRTRAQAVPTLVVGLAFLIGALAMNETPSTELMPALQSPWFAPHVLVYMLSYAALAVAGLMALWYFVASFVPDMMPGAPVLDDLRVLMRIAYPLLTLGMLLGAYWAKIAWGHYWSWDPKETAAFVSWAAILLYLHLDARVKLAPRMQLSLVFGAGLTVAFCWLLLNVLPSASSSVHVYAN